MSTAEHSNLEIERKFLLVGDEWKKCVKSPGKRLSQGYLCSDETRSIRVRIAGDVATLTVKGAREGISRSEFQYEIPVVDAERLLALCMQPLIDKTRHIAHFGGMRWEVDIFHSENEGLRVAEVELEDPNQVIELPEWVGEEVSEDPRYYNSCLVKAPFSTW